MATNVNDILGMHTAKQLAIEALEAMAPTQPINEAQTPSNDLEKKQRELEYGRMYLTLMAENVAYDASDVLTKIDTHALFMKELENSKKRSGLREAKKTLLDEYNAWQAGHEGQSSV